MATFWELLNQRQSRNNSLRQQVQHGVVLGFDFVYYLVNVGNITYQAESYLSQRLLVGDRVQLIMGQGTAKIIGLQARDGGFQP